MALVTTKQMLLNAQAEGYAVGAFNVENMEMVQAVVAAAEELRAPVILQTTPVHHPLCRSFILLRRRKSGSGKGKRTCCGTSGSRQQLRAGNESPAGGIYLHYDRRLS